MLAIVPPALYVHIPWCVQKCPYCDFNSHEPDRADIQAAGLSAELERRYLACLLRDLDAELAAYRALHDAAASRPQATALASIFIGGGTPSLASASFYAALLDALEQRLSMASDIEITLEANPGTVEAERFNAYRQVGINRLSVGVQSFSDQQLVRLGRIHSAAEAERALTIARAAGFDNINIDLMHGLPDQTCEDAMRDIECALSFKPEHLSWYQLTIERNTAFYSNPPLLPVEDELELITGEGHRRLESAAYQRYEVSAYAQPGRQSRHNRNYWQFGDYLGIGAGAHAKLSAVAGGVVGDSGKILRRWKTRIPRDYLAADDALAGQREIEPAERPLEFMLNALRLLEGFSPTDFERQTGLPFAAIEPTLASLLERGLLERESAGQGGSELGNKRIYASELGLRYLDSVLAEF